MELLYKKSAQILEEVTILGPVVQIASALTRRKTDIGGITVQALVSANHTDTATVTSHAVEKGIPISDHMYKEPASVTITARFGNSAILEGLQALSNFINGGPERLNEIYDMFLDFQRKSELVTIVTPRRTYKNMAIISIQSPVSGQTYNSLEITISAREVRQATVMTTQYPAIKLQGSEQLNTVESIGDKTAKQTDSQALRRQIGGFNNSYKNFFNGFLK